MAKKVFTDESLQTFVDEIKAGLDSKSSTSHTHKYAGSSSAGGAATSANKVNSSLTVKLNSGTTEGTNQFTFNGSSAKSVNITPSSIGAATSSHNHDDRYYTETEVDTKLSGKANTSHGNHVPATQTASNKVFLRNDNTWATVTPANIGAAASSHTHKVANISDLTATATELNYMDGVTSNVQAQLDGKAASSHTHAISNVSGLQSALDGKAASSHGRHVPSACTSITDWNSATSTGWYMAIGASNAPTTNTWYFGYVTAHTTEYVYQEVYEFTKSTDATKIPKYIRAKMNGTWGSWTNVTVAKAVPSDAKFTDTTYSAAGSSLGLVKSGGDVTISSGVITVNDDSHNHTIANVDNLQTTLDAKQATITGGASTITGSNLTTNRALISNGSGKVAVSAVTSTELGYLDGVTSNVQTQLDNKMNTFNPVCTGSFSMNRLEGSQVGLYSYAGGSDTTASGNYSHAEGCYTTASEDSSHAEGSGTIASGNYSHAEGNNTTASNNSSHAEGYYTTASNNSSHAEGYYTTASGSVSHAEGVYTTASGDGSHAEGRYTTALNYQHAQGHYNNTTNAKEGTNNGVSSGTAFVIGNGTSSAGSNAFRVTYDGKPYAKSNFATAGCDYAEYFEWKDLNPNNEDRRGYFVTLDEDMIKIAEPNDYILGIISGMPSIIGNGDEDWMGRYVFDEFGAFVYEEFEYEEEELDKETGGTKTVTKIGTKYKENPDYDPSIPYIQREDRPEWSAVGMLGVLSVRDDGTCKVNGYCTVSNGGIATASEVGYRVIKRVNDNIVKVVFR